MTFSFLSVSSDTSYRGSQVSTSEQGKDGSGRVIAKIIYSMSSVGFACLGVALLVKAVALGLLGAAAFSSGDPLVGVPAAIMAGAFAAVGLYALKYSLHRLNFALSI